MRIAALLSYRSIVLLALVASLLSFFPVVQIFRNSAFRLP